MKKNKIIKEKGVKFQSLKSKIVILLESRNDVTRMMLTDILHKTQKQIDNALVSLRKDGFRVFPVRGPGTPLRIAGSLTECSKYLNWRRRLHLSTSRRLVMQETEIGEQFASLAVKPKELLKMLNEATNINKE